MRKTRITLVITLIITGIVACQKILPKAPPENELLDGPVEGLSYDENRRFLSGDIAFNNEVFTTQTGLGSIFVATSCGSCHAGDGKGHPFTTLTRFGQVDSTGNQFLHLGGGAITKQGIARLYTGTDTCRCYVFKVHTTCQYRFGIFRIGLRC